jgi:CubicO group peptidase (beta-lactamase class C family)
MAKFGFLYLNNGYWNNSQLIPSNWIARSRNLYKELEFDQGHGIGYGYQWWIYNWANAYTARGSYEQYIVIIPDLNVVVVSTGNTDFHFIRLLVDYILPSAGFYPLNMILLVFLIVGFSAIGAFSVFLFYWIRKKKEIRKLREEFLSDTREKKDKI